METLILKTDTEKINYEAISKAGAIIASGGLAAFPTETVYGLGASVYDEEAAGKIYAAKGRPSDNPLIVHVSAKEQIEELAAEIPEYAKKLIESFMPGPFTIILKKSKAVPFGVTAGLETVALRFPAHPVAKALIDAARVPIAAPSANLSGKPSPTNAKRVIADMNGRIDCIIDGGSCEVGVESTIVDASGDRPVLLRPGGVTLEMLREVAPETEVDPHVLSSVGENEKPKCPGMKYRHYAPDAEVIVVEGSERAVQSKIKELLEENSDKVAGVLTMYGSVYDRGIMISGGSTNREYAKRLFESLRSFDELGVQIVFAEFCKTDGYGLAVKNRLYKAAGNRVIHV